MMYPLVCELADHGVPVAVTCRVLKISRQPYYRWRANPVGDAELVRAYRADALFDAHRDDPEFGYRFLADEARQAGEAMADRTAWRICSELGWFSAFGKKRGKNGKKPGPPVHHDLCAVVDEKGRVRHQFAADAANRLWLADITEHATGEGKPSAAKEPCFILDTDVYHSHHGCLTLIPTGSTPPSRRSANSSPSPGTRPISW
jgi:putative transposase